MDFLPIPAKIKNIARIVILIFVLFPIINNVELFQWNILIILYLLLLVWYLHKSYTRLKIRIQSDPFAMINKSQIELQIAKSWFLSLLSILCFLFIIWWNIYIWYSLWWANWIMTVFAYFLVMWFVL